MLGAYRRLRGVAGGVRRRRRQRRRVVLLTRQLTGPGGVNRSVANLANGLAAAGVDVTVMVLLRHRRIRYALDPAVRVVWVRDMRPRARRRPLDPARAELDSLPTELCEADAEMSALTERMLRRRLASLPPSTVISQRPALHEAAALWAPSHVRCLAVEHTAFDERPPEVRDALRRVAPRLDRLVLLTEANRLKWQDYLGPGHQLEVIPNGLTMEVNGAVSSWSARVVMAAGTLIPRKGFERLIRAYAPLTEEFPGWRLRIFGEGSEEDALRKTIEELGVGDAVDLAGFSSSLHDVMRTASVFAMSSYAEALPMVLLEAMDTGLPVVAFDCTGPRELVDHGRTGVLVEDGDIAGLTAALGTLMSDEALRRRLGEAARSTAEGYRIENVVEQWRALIGEVAR